MKVAQLFEYFPFIIPVIHYAELHYRFKLLPFSRYYIKEPEIIVDVPHRLEPGSLLPVLLLIKDADRFPLFLESVEITLMDQHGNQKDFSFKKNLEIKNRWWYEIKHLKLGELTGFCTIHVRLFYSVRGRRKTCLNGNSLASKGKPLEIYLSPYTLPGENLGWIWGDLHYHTWLTEDFVEFGAPPDASQHLAKALGLSFVCFTDHSYDLDDRPGSWKKTDPEKIKWKQLWSDIHDLNNRANPILIPGEEVSTYNSKKKNVHLLVLNHTELIPGSGDGAEQWFRTRSELSIPEVVSQLQEDSMAIAAHPLTDGGYLQKILLKRGQWEYEDFSQEGIDGYQILNGSFDSDFFRGMSKWQKLLLDGEKKYIYAGNDAHGNFCRYRQIKIPMISMWDNNCQIMGKCRTGIPLPEKISISTIIDTLKKGHCVISNGPLAILNITNKTKITVESTSSPEFGKLKEITVFFGDLTQKKERILFSHQYVDSKYHDRFSTSADLSNKKGYIRVQLTSLASDFREFRCYTNPIWINRDL